MRCHIKNDESETTRTTKDACHVFIFIDCAPSQSLRLSILPISKTALLKVFYFIQNAFYASRYRYMASKEEQ